MLTPTVSEESDVTEEPEPSAGCAVEDVSNWLAFERDAAWTAKLVILRVERLDDIRHFGDCLHDHERHVDELAGLARIRGAQLREPSFVTREAHVIGALVESSSVLAAMGALEIARVARYRSHDATVREEAESALDRLLARHRIDAEARLRWLARRLRAPGPIQRV